MFVKKLICAFLGTACVFSCIACSGSVPAGEEAKEVVNAPEPDIESSEEEFEDNYDKEAAAENMSGVQEL